MPPTPWDEQTEYEIIHSDSPVDIDGYKLGEPCALRCATCSAHIPLTREPSAGIDELPHDPECPQRWVRSEWWRRQFE